MQRTRSKLELYLSQESQTMFANDEQFQLECESMKLQEIQKNIYHYSTI